MANKWYVLQLDLARWLNHNGSGWNTPAKLEIWGGNDSCGKVELLTQIDSVVNTNWDEYVLKFKPSQSYTHFFLQSNIAKISNPEQGNIEIDNIRLSEDKLNILRQKLDTIVDLDLPDTTAKIELVASKSNSYDWIPKKGLSCYTCQNPIATIKDTITYTVSLGASSAYNSFRETFKISYTCESLTRNYDLPDSNFFLIKPTQPVILTPTPSDSSNGIYKWKHIPGLSCYDCQYPEAKVNTTTGFYVYILQKSGCYTTEKFTIHSICNTIDQYKTPILILDTVVRKSSYVFLNAGISKNYSWLPLSGLNCFNCANPFFVANDQQSYTVKVTDQIGCDFYKKFNIKVLDCDTFPKNKYVTKLDTTVKSFFPVELKPSNALNYKWKPIPGLNCYECINPVASIGNSQNFSVVLTDTLNCEWEEVFYIRIDNRDSTRIFVPNVISPNGDGRNETLQIDFLPPKTSLKIYNSIGKLLYWNDNYDNTWYGQNNTGTLLEQGTYWYILNWSGRPKPLTGSIFLKRE
jgi:gliding motility-associated-like protein